jgi:dipeptidase D
MNAEQERLLQEPVFRHFHTLCQIPHPSFREEQISRYLFDWACERGLEAHDQKARRRGVRKCSRRDASGAHGHGL